MSNFKIGDKVHYVPKYFDEDEFENGIVKEVNLAHNGIRVVYHCAGNWDKYMDYTGALTRLEDLKPGWR